MIYQKSSADLITKVTKKHSSSFDQEHLENTDSQATSPPPPPPPPLFPLRSWVDLHRVCFCLQPTLFILNFGQFLVPGTFHLRRCSLSSRLVIRFKSPQNHLDRKSQRPPPQGCTLPVLTDTDWLFQGIDEHLEYLQLWIGSMHRHSTTRR